MRISQKNFPILDWNTIESHLCLKELELLIYNRKKYKKTAKI